MDWNYVSGQTVEKSETTPERQTSTVELIPLSSGSGAADDDETSEISESDSSRSNLYMDLPFLLSGEPKSSWFQAKIADIAFLSDEFVLPEGQNEHHAYTKVSSTRLPLSFSLMLVLCWFVKKQDSLKTFWSFLERFNQKKTFTKS